MKNKFDIQLPPYFAFPVLTKSNQQIVDWGHKYLKANEVYGKTKGEKAILFILDTAGRFDHPDLVENALPKLAKNFSDSKSLADVHGHGTHCAGIAAAADNSEGVIGVAPGAKLVPIKVLNDQGSAAWQWVANGIRYVADLPLAGIYKDHKKIISLSLGGRSGAPELQEAIKYAIAKGCFVLAATGNSGYKQGQNTVDYPGRYEEVITIASVGKSENPSVFSSAGEQVDLGAPGEGVYSTHKNGGYAYLSGTSMATPHVAGVAALILSHFPEIKTQNQLEGFLQKFAKDVYNEGKDIRTGSGTPVLPIYFEQKPIEEEPEEEEPEEENPTPPTRGERSLIVPFNMEGKASMWWRTIEETSLSRVYIDQLEIELQTDQYSPAAIDELTDAVQNYFKNRGLILPNNKDFADAVYWSGRFLELIVGKKLAISVLKITGWDEKGREVLIPAPAFAKKLRNLKRLPVATFILPEGFEELAA